VTHKLKETRLIIFADSILSTKLPRNLGGASFREGRKTSPKKKKQFLVSEKHGKGIVSCILAFGHLVVLELS
jgi:hypothetical protein